MAVLSGLLGWAVENDWTDTNVATAAYGRRRPRRGRVTATGVVGSGVAGFTRRRRAVATVDAAQAVSKLMPAPYGLVPLLACYGALRPSEILGLRRCHVHAETGELLILGVSVSGTGGMQYRDRQKGGEEDGRAVPIPDELMLRVVEHLTIVDDDPLAWLYPSPRPRPDWPTSKSIGSRALANMVAAARLGAGLSEAVTLPALRKTGLNIVKAAVGADEAALFGGHDKAVAEQAYHLRVTRVNDPKAVRAALAAWGA